MEETQQNVISVKEQVALLPTTPGVYQFLNRSGEVIYVGKAKNLRRRVSSYFMESRDHAPKIKLMVRQIAELRHTILLVHIYFLLQKNKPERT